MRLYITIGNGSGNAPVVVPTSVGFMPLPFPFRSRDLWVVLTQNNTAPIGTFDLGDPLDDAFQRGEMSRNEWRDLSEAFGESKDTYRGMTRREVLTLLLAHDSGARCFQARFDSRPWVASDWAGMLTQDKPVK